MIIHEPETIIENNEVVLSARVETDNHAVTFPQSLWYAYPEHYQSSISLRSDPFLAALVLIAQVLGEDLHLKGETSPRLLYGMEQYQQIFHIWNPVLFKLVQLSSDKITHAPPPKFKDQYIAPFSGGVDSFFTLHQAFFPESGQPSWPVTHGLFIHGSPDIALAYADKYQVLSKRYTQLFAELGLELVTIHTNLMQFSAHLIPFGLFLEPPLISTALGLAPLFSGIRIPSGQTYRRYRNMTAGPLTPHYFGTEAFDAKASGGAFKRLDKVETISKWEPAQSHLRVCFGFKSKERTENCSYCSKCIRTRMDLNILGRLNDFKTLKSPFSVLDYLRWGRWLEIGYGWEKNTWKYCRKHRPELLPVVAIGVIIGYLRFGLKKMLPGSVKKWIYKLISGPDPHIMHESDRIQVNSNTRKDPFA